MQKGDTMFITRTISGAVLVAVALVVGLIGGPVLLVASIALSVIGMREFYQAVGAAEGGVRILEICGYAGAALYYLAVYFLRTELHLPILALILIAFLIFMVLRYPAIESEQMIRIFFGFFYVAVLFSFILLTRLRFEGRNEIFLIFFSSWGADTFAYLVGRWIGKRPLAPNLSPKKTVEGALGGIGGAVVLALIFALITKQPVLLYMLICAIGAVISIFGDLAASVIKRNAGLKDFGTWIPGHGGFLDRFDSVLFTAPFVYLLVVLLIS